MGQKRLLYKQIFDGGAGGAGDAGSVVVVVAAAVVAVGRWLLLLWLLLLWLLFLLLLLLCVHVDRYTIAAVATFVCGAKLPAVATVAAAAVTL